MAKTAIADIIIPTLFEKYAIERTAELAAFGQCGIIEAAPEFDEIAAGGGREVKMPFWKDLTATRQLLSDSAPLTVNKITSDQDIARIHNDAQTWSVNHLEAGAFLTMTYQRGVAQSSVHGAPVEKWGQLVLTHFSMPHRRIIMYAMAMVQLWTCATQEM